MNHFLDINQLSSHEIHSLLQRALEFKNKAVYPVYSLNTVANLFYENSTRTRVSFEMAANHLSMSVINLDLNSSSESKGEIIFDTVQTLIAMGIQTVVIRHKQEKIHQQLADYFGADVHIVNAGDGTHAHPSQAILDIMTIMEQKPSLEKLKIAVVGNIKHSRVANSFQAICKKLGVGELMLIAPELWQPDPLIFGTVTDNLEKGLADADVVMCLRVQNERLLENEHMNLQNYRQDFAITEKSLRFAKSDAMVLHPGPINRGVEIDSEIADGKHSFILKQVTNGVYARMAILESVVRA